MQKESKLIDASFEAQQVNVTFSLSGSGRSQRSRFNCMSSLRVCRKKNWRRPKWRRGSGAEVTAEKPGSPVRVSLSSCRLSHILKNCQFTSWACVVFPRRLLSEAVVSWPGQRAHPSRSPSSLTLCLLPKTMDWKVCVCGVSTLQSPPRALKATSTLIPFRFKRHQFCHICHICFLTGSYRTRLGYQLWIQSGASCSTWSSARAKKPLL